METTRPRAQTDARPRQPADGRRAPPPRRVGPGRLGGLVVLAVLGILAFLLLLDVAHNQEDPWVPFFTGNLGEAAAASILIGILAVALVFAVALLLPRRNQAAAASWPPGVTCRSCGGWVQGLDGPCPSCGNPVP